MAALDSSYRYYPAHKGLIAAPRGCGAGRTGPFKGASAEIRLKQRCVGSADIPVTGKIAIAVVLIRTGSVEAAPAETGLHYCNIPIIPWLDFINICAMDGPARFYG